MRSSGATCLLTRLTASSPWSIRRPTSWSASRRLESSRYGDDGAQGALLMTFELGVYSFGNTPRTADGGYGTSAQAIRDVLEAVHLAEEVGLDFFGFGE